MPKYSQITYHKNVVGSFTYTYYSPINDNSITSKNLPSRAGSKGSKLQTNKNTLQL